MPKGMYEHRGKPCIVEGCGKPNYGKGLCCTHYAEKKRRDKGAQPLASLRVPGGRKCEIEDCGLPNKGGGLCAKHYQTKRRRDGKVPERNVRGVCTAEGCQEVRHAKGFCSNHYQILKRNGSLLLKKAPNGSGYTDPHGYKLISKCGEQVREHRWVVEQAIGRKLLPGESVHHKNGVKADNRIENLELWSTSQPYGQRVTDKVNWAKEILNLYKDMG